MADPLATPEQRRDVWMSIAGYIATGLREHDGYAEAAHMALEFAMADDPPREWPAGSWGHRMATGALGDQDSRNA